MNFERNGNIKEQIGVGISDKTLHIDYCLFHIKGVKKGNVLSDYSKYDFKLDMKGNIVESTKRMLELLELNPLPIEEIRKVAYIMSGVERRKFRKFLKEGRTPVLYLEVGIGYSTTDKDLFHKEYLKFKGKVYPVGEAPHVISVNPCRFKRIL